MPVLANPRQEIYCKHRARGMLPTKAALAAGYAAGSSVTHLEADEAVIARIQELMDEHEKARTQARAAAAEAGKVMGQLTGIGQAWVIAKLAENSQRAADDGDYKESNHALELIGKEFGMFQGAKGEGDGASTGQVYDMDKLDAILASTEKEIPIDPNARPPLAHDEVLALVEGHARKPDFAKDRQMMTGSETDAALIEIDCEDITEIRDEPGITIDPTTGEWEEIHE